MKFLHPKVKKHFNKISSHVVKHHKKYLIGVGGSAIGMFALLSIVSLTGIFSLGNQTFAGIGGGGGGGLTANTDRYTTRANTTHTIGAEAGVLLNDTPPSNLSALLFGLVEHGEVTLNSDGSFEYIPDNAFSGEAHFVYSVTDSITLTTTQGNVYITVTPNHPPVAPLYINYSVDENSNLVVDSNNGVLKDALDEDLDPITAILFEKPAHGEVILDTNGSFTYTPDPYFYGSDLFSYYPSDGQTTGDISTAVIAINFNVNNNNDPDTIIIPTTENKGDIEAEFISNGYEKGNGSIKPVSDMNSLIGTKRINLSLNNGEILVPVVMQSVSTTNRVEAIIPAGTVVKSNTYGTNWPGTLNQPRFERTSLAKNIGRENIVSVASFGTFFETLNFQNTGDEDINVLIRIPVPGLKVGDLSKIFYSADGGYTWNEHSTDLYVNVISIGGAPYVEVSTNHFTLFAIASATGSFMIDNDATSTSSDTVTLNIDLPVAAQMRFSNDNTTRSAWESYSTSKAWTLSAGYGSKTVYAQFDTNSDNLPDVNTNDKINYPDPNGGGSCAPGTDCGDLTLQILSGHSYCQYGTDLNFGTTGHSYDAMSLITGFVATGGDAAWFCEDNQGLASRALTIQASDVVNTTTNISAHTIPAASVFVKNPDAYRIEGACSYSSGDSLNQRKSISGSTAILGKLGAYGEGCKIITDNVSLRVDLAASQAVGQYSGTLYINLPNF